jgi:hypothetical protein
VKEEALDIGQCETWLKKLVLVKDTPSFSSRVRKRVVRKDNRFQGHYCFQEKWKYEEKLRFWGPWPLK